MRDLPFVIRFIINIIIYVIYLLIASIIFSFLFPIIMQVLGQDVLNPDLPENQAMFEKIQIFIAILVLLITLIFRKFFYLCGNSGERMVIVDEKISTKKVETFDEYRDDEDMKIYVEKEIK